jgi:Fe-S cluster assembly ATP-binding protein
MNMSTSKINSKENELEIIDLHVNINQKEVLKGIDLKLYKGEVAALMGPNGSGKSTLAYVLMGHPNYEIKKGKIIFKGEDITNMPVDERAKKGLFLSIQYPHEIAGVSLANFLRTAWNAKHEKKTSVIDFMKLLKEKMALLKMDTSFASRYLNEGFSGGEKKKAEILQMAVLQPEFAILDETDSGLDIDALRTVAEGVNSLRNPELGTLIITHYQRILDYIKPDKVYILFNGKIVKSGGPELVTKLEEFGYNWLHEEDKK